MPGRGPARARIYLSSTRAGTCTRHGRRVCVACAVQTAIFPVEHLIWGRLLGPLFGLTL